MELTDENIFDRIEEGNFIILAYTRWCELCPPTMEKLEQLSEDSPNFTYAKFNLSDCPEAKEKFNIIGVPTVICTVGGIVKDMKSGFRDDYYELLENF